MSSARERLVHLLELAGKGPALRAALAEEIIDLLRAWPADCPTAMRIPCEALLERAVRDMDVTARARFATRIEKDSDLPVPVLNELFFDASEKLRANILARNETADLPRYESTPDEKALIGAARSEESFAAQFANLLGVPPVLAACILADESGRSLAIACKGAHISRAGFSALAVLLAEKDKINLWLEGYETIPLAAAERLMQAWSSQKSGYRTAAE